MTIAVYVPGSSINPTSNFIVETFFPLFLQLPDHRFILISDAGTEFAPVPGLEKITIRSQPGNVLLRSLWIERTLTGLLRKIKADVFISAGNFCSLNATLPQYILMPARERLKQAYAKKARLLIVTSGRAKKGLMDKWRIPDDKILIMYPPPAKSSSAPDAEICESIKMKYSEGKEYFLCNSSFQREENFIDLLKSFSLFKKRQQSNFKLLISGMQNQLLEKSIENYKYRKDTIIVHPKNIGEKAAIIAAAYACLLPCNTDEDITYAIGAMQSGVPVITTRGSSVSEITGDAVLFSGHDVKDIGEKMMQLYRDESLRSQLIEKGKRLVNNFTVEKSANRLWQSIMKAMN